MAEPNTHDTAELEREVEQFHSERERVRKIVGSIGGRRSAKFDTTMTVGFIIAIAILFLVDILRHTLGITLPFPPLFSVELGILLVSIKIIWMIHKQAKVEHFQFWILSALEYQLNAVAKRIRNIERRLEGGGGDAKQGGE